MVKLIQNERSWAIELIGYINKSLQNKTLQISKAGGETTINNRADQSQNARKIMFPDILLYADATKSKIIQGWELKLPDIPVTDETYIKDAQYKADILGLNSTILWNFNQVVLYIKDENGNWFIKHQWNELNHIKTREDVETYEDDWVNLLEIVLIQLNEFFVNGTVESNKLEFALSRNLMAILISQNKDVVATYLENQTKENRLIKIRLENWWKETKDEYYKDEPTMYLAYSKTLISNWIIKITFAHLIKAYHNPAKIVEQIKFDTPIDEAINIFNQLTSEIDFYTILSPIEFSNLLPKNFWRDLTDYNAFLTDQGISSLKQEVLQTMLEKSIKGIRREIIGQFTTPKNLADLLVKSAVVNVQKDIIDPCCGSGTIAKAALELKKESLSEKVAHETIWASDKFAFPLQIANLTITDFSSANIPNKVFQSNVFDIIPEGEIEITSHTAGKNEIFKIPQFETIVSNLPFVAFENISEDEKNKLNALRKEIKITLGIELNKRSDLYTYIVAHLWKLLKLNGKLGLIISNSWLGTVSGREFYEVIKKLYHIEYVLISGNQRWFKNAEVITTMLILTKKELHTSPNRTRFGKLTTPLDALENKELMDSVSDHIIAHTPISKDVLVTTEYTSENIKELLEFNISLNALFHDVTWLTELKQSLIPLKNEFKIIRGMRRGWDQMFYPAAGHGIEPQYLSRVIKNSKKITGLYATTDSDAFCCSDSLENLIAKGDTGAYKWIKKFENGVNKTGQPLVETLQKSALRGQYWYEMNSNSTAELITTLNANKRLFYSKTDRPSFINQRLIGLTRKDSAKDLDLYHALLNTSLGMFFIEATGFGKGLGALDLNKESFEKSFILNPHLLSEENKEAILKAFEPLKSREVMNIDCELNQLDRINFDMVVLTAYKLEHLHSKIGESLKSLYETRMTALD